MDIALRSFLSVFVGACIGGSQLLAQQTAATIAPDPRIDTKIMIIRNGAEMKTPQATVWRAYLGDVFTVKLTNGEWLWIDEKGGWLWEKETVPFSTAIDDLSRRLSSAATADNYHLRGVAYLAHSEYDKAIADCSESLRKMPRNAGALNNRGKANYLKGDYKAAIPDFTAAITIDPKSHLYFNNRALAYIETEQYNLAFSDLQTALKLVPSYPEALNNRGIVFQKQNRLDEAMADFTAALKIDPKYVDALGNRAYTHQLKKEYAKAIEDLELAIKNAPQSFEAANDLAWLLATADVDGFRNPARSLELANQACKLSNDQWNTLDTLAAAHAENGQFDLAKEKLTAAMASAPQAEIPRLRVHMDLVSANKPIRQ